VRSGAIRSSSPSFRSASRRTPSTGRCATPTGDGEIVTLEGALGSGVPGPHLDVLTYTRHEGQIWRTVVDVRGRFRIHRGRTLHLRVGDSTHGMAERLRALGLDGASPAALLLTHEWRSLLHAGAPLP
jgi:hypothetical protein